MILLNFSHPLTPAHLTRIRELTGHEEIVLHDMSVHFSNAEPFAIQFESLAASLPLTAEEFQSQPVLLNLPSLNYIAALLLAELHGRMGYFPPIIRMRPIPDALPPEYEVVEILNLNNQRELARARRYG